MRTSAMSMRRPFARPLKVGGKRERRAKSSASAAGAVGEAGEERVTVKLLKWEAGVRDGVSFVEICCQVVSWVEMEWEEEARESPVEVWRESVRVRLVGGEVEGGNL